MNDIYVLNQDFQIIDIIDEYVSTIWRPSYSEIGDFEIYLGASKKAVELLKENRYVVRSMDITVENGIVTYKKVMIIKNIQLVTDVENGDYLTVTGRELKFLLHQRIVWAQMNLVGTAEKAIRDIVDYNAINPTDSKRIIPNLVLSDSLGLTDKIDKQITGDFVDEAIVEICSTYNYGWEMYISNGKIIFRIYTGTDRSYGQNIIPYIVFSEDFENLYNTEYQLNTESYANTTLIGGEGEGAERFYTTIGEENTGLARFEVFTDARDISQNKDVSTDEEEDNGNGKLKLPVLEWD